MKIRTLFFAAAIIITFVMCKAVNNKSDGNSQKQPQTAPSYGTRNPDNPSAIDFVAGMGVGINIGNTLDAIGTATWMSGETGWGNPPISRDLIRALKGYGYKTIRLPVTWAEYMGPGPNFTIEEERMGRVEEVVKWILDEGMYCIINLHHDGGESDKSWILPAASDPEGVAKQLGMVWKQIAERFAGVSQDRLVFEAMNEVGFDKIWNRNSNFTQKTQAFDTLLLLNQTFVYTVRGIKGNEDRFLLISGYWTDINLSCDPFYKMPQDTIEDQLILSVHYYDPSTFTIADNPNNSWGFRDDWGTDSDFTALKGQLNKLKAGFMDKGIPVIMGEYGVTTQNKMEEGRVRWMTAVTQNCLDYGICPVLWDTGGEISRHPPFTMRDSLQAVWVQLRNE